jgi:glycosyltransferase involved in cell wall biosynthesis
VAKALKIIRSHRVDAVWSTFPIATAHAIALAVSQRTRLPWIAEFRDPMWQGDYPPEARVNRAWLQLENEIFAQAQHVVVTTPSAVDLYAERYPAFSRERIVRIENGYDEDTFERAMRPCAETAATGRDDARRPITLLHSGIIYPSERNPTHFFKAIAALKNEGSVTSQDLRVVLRASSNEALYQNELCRLGIEDIVKLEPGLDYLRALREMMAVDGLLLLQASNCNAQIPAKVYEYLRAGRPILALTDPAGDTAKTVATAGGAALIAPLDSQPAIERALMKFLERIRARTWRPVPDDVVRRYSRESQTAVLADVLTDASFGDRAVQRP